MQWAFVRPPALRRAPTHVTPRVAGAGGSVGVELDAIFVELLWIAANVYSASFVDAVFIE